MSIFKELAIGRFVKKLLEETKTIKVSLVVDNVSEPQQLVHIDTAKLAQAIAARDAAEIVIEIGDEVIRIPVKP